MNDWNWYPSGQCLPTEGIHRSDWIQTSPFMGEVEVVGGKGGIEIEPQCQKAVKLQFFSWGSCIAAISNISAGGSFIVWPDYTVVEWIESGFVSSLFTFPFIYFYSIACRNFNQCKLQIDNEYAIVKRLSSLSGYKRNCSHNCNCKLEQQMWIAS